MVTYKDRLDSEIDRVNPTRITVEEVRICEGLRVCSRHQRNAVCCFPRGQQGEDDNNEIIEPFRGNLRVKVIRYLCINNTWGRYRIC